MKGHLPRWSEVFRGALPRSLVHRGRLRKNRPPWPSRLYSISSFCTTALSQFTTSEGNSPYMYNLGRTFGDSTYCHCVREKECQFGCPCSRAEMEAVCGSEAVVGSTAHISKTLIRKNLNHNLHPNHDGNTHSLHSESEGPKSLIPALRPKSQIRQNPEP